MPELLVVRHAESEWNALGIWQGQADPPLSPRGRQQARRAATALCARAVDLVVCSDLARARQTAEIIAALLNERPALLESGLRERDAGEWTGRSRSDICRRWPDQLQRFEAGELSTPPGGEDRHSFDWRVAGAIRRVSALASSSRAATVLVVAHGGVISSLARRAGLGHLRPGHLAGLRGLAEGGGFFPTETIDLLGGADLAAEA